MLTVWDTTTTSHAFIDREAMHVVEHHHDLFSWKKYNNYTDKHINIVQLETYRMLFESGNKLFTQKYNVLTLLALGLCCVMPQTSRKYF
jgi:hypothetical protein